MDENKIGVKPHPYLDVLSDPVYGAIGVIPPPSDASLWRFMSLAKFLSMLETRSLYLARIDCFEDKFEGTLPQSTANTWLRMMDELDKSIEAQMLDKSLFTPVEPTKSLWHSLRERTFINCWHMSEYESDGMWKLYSSGNVHETVGIRTSAEAIYNSVQNGQGRFYLGKVNYIDFHSTDPALSLPPSPVSGFFVKRNAFEHEREVRMLIQSSISPTVAAIGQGACGKPLAIDANTLIQQLVVAPGAPDWFFDLVKRLVTRYGLRADLVTRSSLDQGPATMP